MSKNIEYQLDVGSNEYVTDASLLNLYGETLKNMTNKTYLQTYNLKPW